MSNNSLETGKVSLVESFGSALLKAGKKYQNLVLLHGDNAKDLGTSAFIKNFADRHFNFGLGEENMVTSSMGFVVRGKTPVVVGYTNFLVGRGFEQIRNCVCAPNLNVKIVGLGSGFSFAQDGPGYQVFEDIALMKCLPNMKILSPSDHLEMQSAMETMMMDYGPTYLRLNNLPAAIFHNKGYKFKFGKVDIVREGDYEMVIFSMGVMMSKCLEVANLLKERGVNATVVNLSSIKPLDSEGVENILKKAKVCFTVEDHNVIGGLGDSVGEVITNKGLAVKLCKLGIEDRFGESGKSEDLYRKFGLDAHSLLEKILSA